MHKIKQLNDIFNTMPLLYDGGASNLRSQSRGVRFILRIIYNKHLGPGSELGLILILDWIENFAPVIGYLSTFRTLHSLIV